VAGGMTRAGLAFTEAVDWASASIAAHGSLTVQGADLIRGTAEAMCRCGHLRITVDLQDVVLADTEALDLLRDLSADLRSRHGRLILIEDEEDQ
jgi:anti-anti-sigma regulatory factor